MPKTTASLQNSQETITSKIKITISHQDKARPYAGAVTTRFLRDSSIFPGYWSSGYHFWTVKAYIGTLRLVKRWSCISLEYNSLIIILQWYIWKLKNVLIKGGSNLLKFPSKHERHSILKLLPFDLLYILVFNKNTWNTFDIYWLIWRINQIRNGACGENLLQHAVRCNQCIWNVPQLTQAQNIMNTEGIQRRSFRAYTNTRGTVQNYQRKNNTLKHSMWAADIELRNV